MATRLPVDVLHKVLALLSMDEEDPFRVFLQRLRQATVILNFVRTRGPESQPEFEGQREGDSSARRDGDNWEGDSSSR
jgi:hypothetical protein